MDRNYVSKRQASLNWIRELSCYGKSLFFFSPSERFKSLQMKNPF